MYRQRVHCHPNASHLNLIWKKNIIYNLRTYGYAMVCAVPLVN